MGGVLGRDALCADDGGRRRRGDGDACARTRVGLFVEEVVDRHKDEVVVAVCHGGVVECVFGHVFNVGPWGRCEVWDHNTAVSHFEYVAAPGKRSVWRLHYHNRVEHLV